MYSVCVSDAEWASAEQHLSRFGATRARGLAVPLGPAAGEPADGKAVIVEALGMAGGELGATRGGLLDRAALVA